MDKISLAKVKPGEGAARGREYYYATVNKPLKKGFESHRLQCIAHFTRIGIPVNTASTNFANAEKHYNKANGIVKQINGKRKAKAKTAEKVATQTSKADVSIPDLIASLKEHTGAKTVNLEF